FSIFFEFIALSVNFLFFFFQAEDGIRDFHVTGVQTCALPILIKNLKTISNEGGGIGIILPMLLSSKQKNVSIKIDRHVDNSSQFGVAIQGFKGKPGQRSL